MIEKEALIPFKDAFKGGVSAFEHGQSIRSGMDKVRRRERSVGGRVVAGRRERSSRACLGPLLSSAPPQGFMSGIKSIESFAVKSTGASLH